MKFKAPAGRARAEVGHEMPAPPRVRRLLAQLPEKSLNFDRATVMQCRPPPGWVVDDIRQPLRSESPGTPATDGTFALAKRLIRGYEFADPSIVRAFYDPHEPLLGRNMVLRLRALGVVQVLAGVRILEVIDEFRRVDTRPAQVWGWRYGTLDGHVEMGEMSWEVWKWLDSGEIEFRVRAVSREAPIANPVIRLGFRILGPHERKVFFASTCRRMERFTAIVLDEHRPAEPLRQAASEMTARPGRHDTAHQQLAHNLDEDP